MKVVGSVRIAWRHSRIAILASLTLLSALGQAGEITYDVDPSSGRVNKATYPDGTYITYGYDANGNRTSAIVTDLGVPSAPGIPTFSSVTSSSALASWTAATDNVAVVGYQYRLNGGAWISTSSTSATLSGLAAATNYTVDVRAKDGSDNFGTASSNSFVTPDNVAPSAPGVPNFSNVTTTSATASWAVASDNVAVTGYEYSINGGGWVSNSTSVSVNLSGLSPGTNYTLQVKARDDAGNFGAISSNSFLTLDNGAPTAPGTPSFSSVTANSATASWSAASDNVAVTAYEYSLNGGAWVSNGLSLSANLSGLSSGLSYTLQVRARDNAGNFGPTSSNSFVTLDNVSPSAPGTPSFSSIGQNSVTASWTAASDNVEVTEYQYSINGGAWTSNGNSLSKNLTGLAAATSYTFQVRAKDAASNTSGASSGSFSTTDTTAPSAPGTPSFSAITGTSATASWTAATDNVGVSSYEYSLNGGAWTSNGASLSKNFTGLTSGVTYSLQVRARDAATNAGVASSSSFTTVDEVAPTAPGTPSFSSITGTSATATWSAASDNVGVTGYEYSLNGGAWTSNGASLSKGLTGLTPATGYTFQVRAKDAGNNTGSASSNSFNTLDTVAPGAPGTPAFSSITGNSATASWAAASDNVGILRYEYSLNGGGWTSVGSAQSVNLVSLTSAASYSVQVRAVDTSSNPGASSSNSFTTLDNIPPGPPGTPSFSSLTQTSATASWGAASDNVGILRYEYSLNGGSWTSVGTALSVNLSGLSVGGSYTFQVRAIDTSSNPGSASSNSFNTIATVTLPLSMGFATVQPGGTTATYSITAGGDLLHSQPQSQAMGDFGDWLSPKVGMSGFQVYVTVDSNPCSSGTFNTWLSLSGTWTYTRSVTGTRGAQQQCNITLQIRHSSNPSVILATGHVAITAVGQ
jgi:YD repeat-containing protein